MSAGALRARIRFEARQNASDGYGNQKGDWATEFSRWAELRPMKGGEDVQAARLTGTQPVLIIVRLDPETKTIQTNWRAVHDREDGSERIYALKTAEDMEQRRDYLTMIGVAGDADSGQ